MPCALGGLRPPGRSGHGPAYRAEPLCERTLAVIAERVADIVTVPDDGTIAAMRFVWERMKLLIEPSAAVPVAAVLAGQVPGRRIGIVLSGGNLDLDRLPWLHMGR